VASLVEPWLGRAATSTRCRFDDGPGRPAGRNSRATAESTTVGHADAEVDALAADECLALLRLMSLGSIIYLEGEVPAARPLEYMMIEDSVVFAVAGKSRLRPWLDHALVSFQVDVIDAESGSGWTVLGTGTAESLTSAQGSCSGATFTAGRPAGTGDGVLFGLHLTRLGGQRVARDARAPTPGGLSAID
jgi:hypothetical protein